MTVWKKIRARVQAVVAALEAASSARQINGPVPFGGGPALRR
jgi:hypothetical protein